MHLQKMIAPGVKLQVPVFFYIEPIFFKQKLLLIYVKIKETLVPETSL